MKLRVPIELINVNISITFWPADYLSMFIGYRILIVVNVNGGDWVKWSFIYLMTAYIRLALLKRTEAILWLYGIKMLNNFLKIFNWHFYINCYRIFTRRRLGYHYKGLSSKQSSQGVSIYSNLSVCVHIQFLLVKILL